MTSYQNYDSPETLYIWCELRSGKWGSFLSIIIDSYKDGVKSWATAFETRTASRTGKTWLIWPVNSKTMTEVETEKEVECDLSDQSAVLTSVSNSTSKGSSSNNGIASGYNCSTLNCRLDFWTYDYLFISFGLAISKRTTLGKKSTYSALLSDVLKF